eukprot:RCo031126
MHATALLVVLALALNIVVEGMGFVATLVEIPVVSDNVRRAVTADPHAGFVWAAAVMALTVAALWSLISVLFLHGAPSQALGILFGLLSYHLVLVRQFIRAHDPSASEGIPTEVVRGAVGAHGALLVASLVGVCAAIAAMSTAKVRVD